MSDLASTFYGDYGLAEATARRRRLQESVANQQAARLGQMRGERGISKLTKQYMEGFQPQMAAYGKRGLAGPKWLRQEVEAETMGDDLMTSIRFRPRFFWFVIATLLQPIVYRIPKFAFSLMSVKSLSGADNS